MFDRIRRELEKSSMFPSPIPGLRTDVPEMQPGVGGTPVRVEMGMSATD